MIHGLSSCDRIHVGTRLVGTRLRPCWSVVGRGFIGPTVCALEKAQGLLGKEREWREERSPGGGLEGVWRVLVLCREGADSVLL